MYVYQHDYIITDYWQSRRPLLTRRRPSPAYRIAAVLQEACKAAFAADLFLLIVGLILRLGR